MTNVFRMKLCGFYDHTNKRCHRKIREAPKWNPFCCLGPMLKHLELMYPHCDPVIPWGSDIPTLR